MRQDPMSHRIIEKRRRDRMNNCLADLSRLVPTNYLKKGRGRIEKTEIIEMAIKHLKHLQNHPCKDPSNCEVARTTEIDHKRQFKTGYTECLNEAVRYITDSETSFSRALIERLSAHLVKHYEKVSGGMCYAKALGMVTPDDTKPILHMEVDSHSESCFHPDSVVKPASHNGHINSFPYDNRISEVPEFKEEVDFNGINLRSPQPLTPVKGTSQLREMLQNPGVPVKDLSKTANRNCNGSTDPSPISQPVSVVVSTEHLNELPKPEEGYYKFKNNIKHRFNNDIRQHTSSPTDSHLSDRMSLPDEDHNNNKLHVPESFSLHSCHSTPEERVVPNGLCNGNSPAGHAFSPYSSNRLSSELSVKIPDRTIHQENGILSSYGNQHWESQAETTSSCGSNPSPPLNAARSNGSSSGYSTNGENNSSSSVLKPHPNGSHSPNLSPYSRTPDRLSNRSPSPLPTGIPIFALHPKGSFYIPLTIDSSILVPYLSGLDDLVPVIHPISICVNLCNNSLKVEKMADPSSTSYRPQTSFIMNKYQERFVFPERPMYYPCPTSPHRNGCT